MKAEPPPLFCFDEGPRGAPSLVFLHALGTDSRLWAAQASHFSVGHRVIRIDAPGHGHSPMWPAGTTTLPAMALAVWRALDGLGLGSVALVGTSMGAVTALQAAAMAPDRVTHLVLCGARLVRTPQSSDEILERSRSVRRDGMAQVASTMVARWFPAGLSDVERAAATSVHEMLLNTPTAAYVACAETMGHYDLSAHLKALQHRTLLLTGELDEDIPEHFQQLARNCPEAALVCMAQVGHFPNVQRSAAFNTAVAPYLP